MPAFAHRAPAGSRQSFTGGGRPRPRDLAIALVAFAAAVTPAAAQQGSIQVTGAAQAVTGDPARLSGESRLEPDLAINWFQPRGTGSLQMELRATRRGTEPHLGRAYLAWRDVKARGAIWTFEAGDFYFTPGLADYRFTNLTTPAVTLAGGSVAGRTPRASFNFVGGRTTAWRNIFGSDPDTLDQNLGLARAGYRAKDWLDVNVRASSIRTENVKEFTFSVAASDQAGGGIRAAIGPSMYVVADAGYVNYRNVGESERIHDFSATVGTSVVHSRGWFQANASRFSPGEFPVLNYPHADRESAFAAAEFDVFRNLRVFGGGEVFRGNLDPSRAASTLMRIPETAGGRGFGGLRVRLFGSTALSVRLDDGDRRTRRSGAGFFVDSDTGVISAELQTRVGNVTSFFRASKRENVESVFGNGYKQTDGTVQVFFNVSGDIQLFGTGIATRNVLETGAGSTYYQLGGGGQFQLFNRTMWLRVEGIAARNQDMISDFLVARESFNVGVNGTVARNTTVGLNMFAERTPSLAPDTSPWLGRTTFRVTRSFPTGVVRLPGANVTASEARSRGTGTIVGSVFADWDADGVPDVDEGPIEGIPIVLGNTSTKTSAGGDFTFTNVPSGGQRVQVDLAALPVDFDPPTVPALDLDLTRNETRRVAFGLVPLGAVSGRVLRDANANNVIDAADEPVDDAVLVLDAGQRSEQVRKGQFRFDAVRSGRHTLELLLESLPEGATILGERTVEVGITRERQASRVDFLVRIDKRPEIRKTFPARGGPTAGGARAPAGAPATAKPGTTKPGTAKPGTGKPPATPASPPRRPAPAPEAARDTALRPVQALPSASRGFTIQVAALSDLDSARLLATELQRSGYRSYVVNPPPEDANGLYRVRVGRYTSRASANRVVTRLERMRGEKLWVTRER